MLEVEEIVKEKDADGNLIAEKKLLKKNSKRPNHSCCKSICKVEN